MNIITSKENNRIKELIKLRDDAKYRKNNNLYYVEGERIIADAPKSQINSIYITKNHFDKYKNIINCIDEDKIFIVDDNIYDKIKDTKNSQGIIAILKSNILFDLNCDIINKSKFVLILDDISDPGNLGTIIRVAEAFKVDLIIITKTSCDVYNPKVIRASMSSIFRSNIYISNDIINDMNLLNNNKFNIIATTLHEKSIDITNYNFPDKIAIIFGNEANGVREELINISNTKLTIPMFGEIESLNVAISTSIICYEVMKQKYYEL